MAAWMRFRGMAWRPTLEMSGATIGLAIVMIGLDWLDVVQQSSVRGWAFGFCGPACVDHGYRDAVPPGSLHRPDWSSNWRTRQARRARGLRLIVGPRSSARLDLTACSVVPVGVIVGRVERRRGLVGGASGRDQLVRQARGADYSVFRVEVTPRGRRTCS